MKVFATIIGLSLFVLNSPHSFSQDKQASIPYLGPGADVLTTEEYIKTYTKYIKESILAGFPPNKCGGTRCEQALGHFFQSTGLFTYPIPAGADVKIWKNPAEGRECFEGAGVIIQILREKGGALLEANALLTKNPKVLPALSKACREGRIILEQDLATGLERVANIPVGYPHPLLCADSQGIVFRRIQFNNDRTECKPILYEDNSWLSQLRLSQESCTEIRKDLKLAWSRKISSSDFARRQRDRQQRNIREFIIRRGGSEKQAKDLVKKYYSGAFDHDLNYVGNAMRNLENCNAMRIGDSDSMSEESSKFDSPNQKPKAAPGR